MDLSVIAREIREILENRRKEISLDFEENDHIYHMKNLNGQLKNDWPSVSKVIKYFYKPFDSEYVAELKSEGDLYEKERLLKEWKREGDYSTNMGSRTHYLLESESLNIFNIKKDIRTPIFDCDSTQIMRSDSMVQGGIKFLNLMKNRGAQLLDTEIVLGDPDLGYTGQGDTVWLIKNKENNDFGFIITDYKTNKEKNFTTNQFTEQMFPPFQMCPNNALGHYKIQLPLYGKLLLKMLENTKYNNVKLYGCIIVHLKDTSEFIEYRISKEIIDTVMNLDIKKYLK